MQATQKQDDQDLKVQSEGATESPCPMAAKPQAEHEWLHRLIGKWAGEGQAAAGPGQPPVTWKTTEVFRSLGGMWVVGEATGEMPGGGTATTLVTLGYDPQRGRYTGTFVGSMMAHLWVYEGRLVESGNVLTLDTEGPGMSAEVRSAKYQDVLEFKSEDERTLTSLVLGPDGQWQPVMTATYRRIE